MNEELKEKLIQTNLEEYEVCVMCGAITNIPKSMPMIMKKNENYLESLVGEQR